MLVSCKSGIIIIMHLLFVYSRYPSTSTVRREIYNDWSTRNGPINHPVSLLVTTNVVVSKFFKTNNIMIVRTCTVEYLLVCTNVTHVVLVIILYRTKQESTSTVQMLGVLS